MRTTLLIALIFVGSTVAFTGLAPAAATGGDEPEVTRDVGPRGATDVQQLVFFAVLEGLYRDGVDTETAQLLARATTQTVGSLPRSSPATRWGATRSGEGSPRRCGPRSRATISGPVSMRSSA